MICSGILSEDNDHFCLVKIFERNRTFSEAKTFGQRDAAGFMTHVTAVGQIVSAELTSEKLIKKSSLVTRSTARVKGSFVRGDAIVKMLRDFLKSIFPGDWLIM